MQDAAFPVNGRNEGAIQRIVRILDYSQGGLTWI
jgi:hypothetical protein